MSDFDDTLRPPPDQDSLISRELRLTLRNLDALIDMDGEMFVRHIAARWAHRFELLEGAEREAYQAFKREGVTAQAALAAAQQAQARLRTAIENLGRVVAPKPGE